MHNELRNAIAQTMYEVEHHIIPEDDNSATWNRLRPYRKAPWYARAELAVNTYIHLTTVRYMALSEAEIAPRVDECNATLQAGMRQE